MNCRAKAGPCDIADFCTGTAATCPADGMLPAGSVCRNASGVCDVAEQCTGAAATCPADAAAPPSVVCRAAAGVCDAAETCDGIAKSCPANARLPATAVCRPATGTCDIAEYCPGTGNNCPTDRLRANGTTCSDGNASTVGDVCTGGTCAGVDHCVGVTCTASDQCHAAGTCVNHTTGACSNPPKPEGTLCAGGGGTALICSAGQCTHTAVPVDAGTAASWIESDSGGPMAVLTDDRILVWSTHKLYSLATGVATPAPLVWPADATVNGGSTHYGSVGAQIVTWSTPADGDYIYSSGENKHAFRADGTHAWTWLGPGCCDYVQNAAYDPVRNHLLNSSTYNALATLDANTGSVLTTYQPIVPAYQTHSYSVAGDSVFHVGGSDNIVAQQSLVDGAVEWSVNFAGVLASGSLLHGAVAGDGTLVVGSSGDHGRIMRLNADGTVHFSVQNGTSTAPVISETAIYVGSAVGTTYALQSYGFEGDLRWSVPVAGPPTSLLVGDDGVVFASLAGGAGEVVGLRESDGSMAVHFVNVEGGGELMLRGGKLLLKSPNHLYALPVGASDYPLHAPWPVKLHDNHRSSARAEFAPLACSASDQCHVGVYDPRTHLCTNPIAADGTACNDGNASTFGDSCTAGTCTGVNHCVGVTCTPADQCHTAGTCDPATGACSNPAAADGTSCSDGNRCTQWDVCSAGACVGQNPVTCMAADQCHATGTCDPMTGGCSTPPIADGTPCADGDACTQSDTCDAGACIPRNPIACVAADQCHVPGTCNPGTGICSNPTAADATPCSDGNACTQSDRCSSGVCTAGPPVTCIPADPCHPVAFCVGGTGTCSNPPLPIPPAAHATFATNVMQTSFIANWEPTPDAGTYYLDVASDPNFTHVVLGDYHVGAPASPVLNLAGSTTYYYRVRAGIGQSGSCGTTGNSNTVVVTTASWGTPAPISDGAGNAEIPQVAVDTSGNATAVWDQYDGSRFNIWANRYTAGTGWGAPTLIETDNVGSAGGAQVAVDGSGNATAVWYQSDGARYNIWTNRYVVGTGWGTATLIETDNAGSAFGAQVAADGSGNVTALWHQSDGIRFNIWANRYVPGTGWATATLIETGSGGDAFTPQVAADGSGNATAVWHQSDGIRNNIWANRYVPGTGWATATLIEADQGDAGFAQVAVDGGGNVTAVWQQHDGTRYNIWANRYMAGTGWATATLIETDAGFASFPQVAVDGGGNAIAVWQQHDGTRLNIWANRYAVGTGWATATLIETDNAGDARDPQVAVDGVGNATAVWYQRNGTRDDIWANRYTVGTGWATATLIETDNSGTAGSPQVALDVRGNAITVWHQSDGTRSNIYANRFVPPPPPPLATIPIGGSPGDARLSPDGTRVYVANNNTIDVIDVASATLIDAIPTTHTGASDVRVSPDGSTLYVGYGYGHGSVEVTRIDVATHTETGHLAMPTTWGSVPLALSPDGSKLYAGLYPFGPIQTIDVATFSTGATFGSTIYDAYLSVSPDGGHLWVGNLNTAAVRIVDVATSAQTSFSVPGGGAPVTVFSPDGTLAYVRSGTLAGTWVSKVDVASLSILATTPLNENAQGEIAIGPLGKRLVVTNSDTSSVTVLNAATMSILSRTALPSGPFGVAVTNSAAYLPIYASGTVMVLPLP